MNKVELEKKLFGSHYEIIKELGRGGMGAVYLANDLKLKRQVALKVLTLSEEFSDEMKKRAIYSFKREGLAIASLNHTNIVNIFDMGNEDESIHYIVLELIEGQPVSKIMLLHPLPAEIVLNISVQICDALSYVHRHGVIHRDIKTENIMLLGKGLAKLTDFGIAKFDGEEKNEDDDGSLVGTILYMSPEQLNSPNDVDEKADLYSFAVSMYEMLTGTLPIKADNVSAAIMKILKETPKPPSYYNKELPKALDEILLKALSKDKEKRQNNVETFAKEIRSITEYKNFLEVRDIQFAKDFGGKETKKQDTGVRHIILDNELVSETVLINDFKEKEINITETNVNKSMELVNLDWLDHLNFLSKEVEILKNEKSLFIESLKYIKPIIDIKEVMTLVSSTKALSNQKDILLFLSSFDGKKTFKDVIEEKVSTNIFELFEECLNKELMPSETKKMLDSLNFVVSYPLQMRALIVALRNEISPNEMIRFLDAIDNKKSLFEIIENIASIEKCEQIFNFFYKCHQQEIISAKIEKNMMKNIFIGDMLVAFSYVTSAQVSLAVKEKEDKKYKGKLFGDILLNMGFVTQENLVNTLKLQLWYKQLLMFHK